MEQIVMLDHREPAPWQLTCEQLLAISGELDGPRLLECRDVLLLLTAIDAIHGHIAVRLAVDPGLPCALQD
jgi:hypothetical protein